MHRTRTRPALQAVALVLLGTLALSCRRKPEGHLQFDVSLYCESIAHDLNELATSSRRATDVAWPTKMLGRRYFSMLMRTAWFCEASRDEWGFSAYAMVMQAAEDVDSPLMALEQNPGDPTARAETADRLDQLAAWLRMLNAMPLRD